MLKPTALNEILASGYFSTLVHQTWLTLNYAFDACHDMDYAYQISP